MKQIKFPNMVEDLSAALLTEALSELHPQVEVDSFDVIECINCDSGFASTADRILLDLHYRPNKDQGLPTRVILKTMLETPHAPGEMFDAEVRFYRELRPHLNIVAPHVYAAVFDSSSGQFGVIMEDLTLRNAIFPDVTTPVTLDQVRSLIGNLAEIHARLWQSPRLDSDLSWLCTPASGGMSDFFRNIFPLIESHLNNEPWRQEMLRPLDRSPQALFCAMLTLQETVLENGPRTLLHGDTHQGNTFLLPDGSVGLLDFQLTMQGCFSRDLTYYITTALDIEQRRHNESDLIRFYLDELHRRGVASPPNFDSAWLLHRQAALWGLVIGWMTCPTRNYGKEITELNLQRLIAAVLDLETLKVA
ncbi:MAG: phosphotransferase [Halieaceae bacterium]|jgi:hypothetical protein|nr:phosphotransferase [Halieaceae bacterium]